jgi:protein-tyrosine phosphatase
MKILFVCVGNICRSPAMHHLMKKKIEEKGLTHLIEVDSSAISNWNTGDEMSEKMREAAKKEGFFFGKHRAKTFSRQMYKEYDYIFVATNEILNHLREEAATEGEKKKIFLATAFSPSCPGKEIPDPYRHGQEDYDQVFHMIHVIINELLEHLIRFV